MTTRTLTIHRADLSSDACRDGLLLIDNIFGRRDRLTISESAIPTIAAVIRLTDPWGVMPQIVSLREFTEMPNGTIGRIHKCGNTLHKGRVGFAQKGPPLTVLQPSESRTMLTFWLGADALT